MELQKRVNMGEVIMKRLVFLILIVLPFNCCVSKKGNIEKIIEDEVEVIVNHLEPYQIKGEPNTFSLEEEFLIDTESVDLADLGIDYMEEFDVDSNGNIYFYSSEQLLKFDNHGHFVKIIGRKGQGPGEYLSVHALRITATGEISAFDEQNAKFIFYHPDGTLNKEIKKTSGIFTFDATCLDNGNFLFRERQNLPEKGIRTFHYSVLDESFKKIKDLNPTFWIEIPYFNPDKISFLGFNMSREISDDKIFVGSNMNDNIEIEVYDLQGELLRKVRKESKRIKIPLEYKEGIVERWKKSPVWDEWDLKRKHYFPDHFHPFKEFWVDDEERIFVDTYEECEEQGEHILHIFNPEGIFVGSTSLKEARARKFKNNRLYCVYRKESGFQELVTYKINWEYN